MYSCTATSIESRMRVIKGAIGCGQSDLMGPGKSVGFSAEYTNQPG